MPKKRLPHKKIYTRAEFEKLRIDSAGKMARDKSLSKDALNVLVRADRYRWVHQTTWFGEPILNLPQDIFAIQEIIFKTRPEFIIEVGVAWGGTLLFYSTLMEVLGGKKIIGIDIYIPNDLREKLASYKKLSKRMVLIKGSSIEQGTINKVKSIIGDSRKTLIVLDSYHAHAHVLKELRLYSPLVGRGFYLVCGDTIIEDIPEQKHRARPWGPGNNPKTALRQFLKENSRFEIDTEFDNKLLFTCCPNGYLRCRKN
jgi:cephalosporin hydroxylase